MPYSVKNIDFYNGDLYNSDEEGNLMKRNAEMKRRLIGIFGYKCFIEELGIRSHKEIDKDLARFKGKGQRKKMYALTYHHIVEKCRGGKSSIENGALLRNINHQWFNTLSKERQAEINSLFQAYKREFLTKPIIQVTDLTTEEMQRQIIKVTALTTEEIQKPMIIDLSKSIELEEERNEDYLTIPAQDFTPEDYLKYKQERNARIFEKFR